MQKTIVQIMLGQGRGGLEQVALDYHLVLTPHHKSYILGRPHKDYHIKIDENSVIPFKSRGKYDFISFYKIKKLISKLQPDVVFLHGNRAINLAPYINCPQIIAVLHNPRYSLDAVKYCHKAVRVSIGFANAVYTPPLETINNAINLGKFSPKPRRNPLIIGTLSRLHERKGLDILLKALKKASFPYKLIIAGEGEEEKALKHLSQGMNVEFIGWIKDREEYFKSIDCLLVPSRTEPFGLTIIEAFSAGVPVLASNTEGPSEIITHETSGFLFEKDNVEALVKALEDFNKQQDLTPILNAARLKCETTYSYEALEKRLLKLIET